MTWSPNFFNLPMEYEYKVLSETDFDSSWNFHVGFSITTRHVAGVPGCWRAVAKFGGGRAFFSQDCPLSTSELAAFIQAARIVVTESTTRNNQKKTTSPSGGATTLISRQLYLAIDKFAS
jgi:hypothetical protein